MTLRQMPSKGRFIVFEGGDGVGKSTQISLLSNWLTQQSVPHCMTREPGGCPLAEEIRTHILAANHAPIVELMLLMTARAAHISTVIRPALQKSEWVLCDRFIDSTLAYQGFGNGQDMVMIEQLQQIVAEEIQPDCTVLLDMPYSSVLQRKPLPADGIESRDSAYQQRVYQGFRDLAKKNPSAYLVLNAEREIADLHQDILAAITELSR